MDRELISNVLTPLGFEVAQADSGLACLERIPVFDPDVILMDLAMPEMDGWETLRRVRAAGHTRAALAILSANAFEKGTDNDFGIGPSDFFTKPLQVEALLDWLGERLALTWEYEPIPTKDEKPTPSAQVIVPPPEEHLEVLQELIDQGYARGILAKLAEIRRLDPRHAAFVDPLQALAERFQYEAMQNFIRKHAYAAY